MLCLPSTSASKRAASITSNTLVWRGRASNLRSAPKADARQLELLGTEVPSHDCRL